MDRNIGRQGPMSMSPGMMRRPGGMQTGSNREAHLATSQNHSSSAPSYQSQPPGLGPAAGALNNGGSSPPTSSSPSAMGSSSSVHHHALQQQNHQQAPQSQHSQHDELIRYINEAWNSITTDKSQNPPVFYKSAPEPRLPGFTPFDLEGWWGQRLVHQINLGAHGHQ
ncbi:MAPK regulated corepressor interacting protein 2 [Anopheles cruzii]|uniref:MAPK regulated corepressor interacting protein 2 n=1 Tax=Anopheles cruzii TaxID=68878 RepID=UPI0022EC21B3|nr:MAPK regulated corepressor interacting protein 2 [Anopheles cruzii]